MSRIEINSDNRVIVVDCDTDLPDLAKTALDLWQQTDTPKRTGAGSAGFTMERASQWDHDQRHPVRAEADAKEGE